MSLAIHWFRRDLRLTDNTALNAAAAEFDSVLPVYILSDWRGHHRWTGPPRQEFLCGCLAELAASLDKIGSRLLILQGRDQVEVLEGLVRSTGAKAIFFNRDPDLYGAQVEQRLREAGTRLGIQVTGFLDHALHGPDEVKSGEGRPYKVFSAFARTWGRLDKTAPGKAIRQLNTPRSPHGLSFPTLETWDLTSTAHLITPGEKAARKRLDSFLDDRIFDYGEERSLPGNDSTSRISQDLRWGLLSPREIYAEVLRRTEEGDADQKRNASLFINELAWREFSFHVLHHFPQVLDCEFLPQFRQLPWAKAGDQFDAWCEGRTGFPIVDAGMRQLAATGFIHNRVRMIVAMFLCKDLHLSWKLGEQFFMQRLVDGEIAINNTGWQWCASVGTDAQPYFRIQNPWSQTKRHDPEGRYIHRWVPELRDVPVEKLATPPKPGERLARNYPAPIVDHAREREITLETFKQAAARFKSKLPT